MPPFLVNVPTLCVSVLPFRSYPRRVLPSATRASVAANPTNTPRTALTAPANPIKRARGICAFRHRCPSSSSAPSPASTRHDCVRVPTEPSLPSSLSPLPALCRQGRASWRSARGPSRPPRDEEQCKGAHKERESDVWVSGRERERAQSPACARSSVRAESPASSAHSPPSSTHGAPKQIAGGAAATTTARRRRPPHPPARRAQEAAAASHISNNTSRARATCSRPCLGREVARVAVAVVARAASRRDRPVETRLPRRSTSSSSSSSSSSGREHR